MGGCPAKTGRQRDVARGRANIAREAVGDADERYPHGGQCSILRHLLLRYLCDSEMVTSRLIN